MGFENKICRLCFSVIENQCEIIEETIREVFVILLIELNLDLSKEAVICGDCAKTAVRCLNFKSVSVHNEQQNLSSTVNCAETKSMLLDDPENVKNTEGTVSDSISKNMCIFCVDEMKSEELKIGCVSQTQFFDMLPLFLPEKDYKSKTSHITCSSCRDELQIYFNFIFNCFYTEQMINTYIQVNGPSNKVNLTNLRYWLVQNGLDLNNGCFHTNQLNRKLNIIKLNVKKSNTFSCDMCPYVAKCKRSIKLHKLKKHKVHVYQCTQCTFVSKWRSNLSRHMSFHDVTAQSKTYKCPLCTYESKHGYYVKRHAAKHLDVKRYKCLQCPFETRHETGLRHHKQIHNTAETHKCTQEGCTYETKWRGCLKMHALTHKELSEVTVYRCTVCEYQTKWKSHLTRHLSLFHKDVSDVATHRCTQCTYTTKYKFHLKRHMEKGSHNYGPEGEYNCNVCGHVVKHKKNLNRHMKTHQKTK